MNEAPFLAINSYINDIDLFQIKSHELANEGILNVSVVKYISTMATQGE